MEYLVLNQGTIGIDPLCGKFSCAPNICNGQCLNYTSCGSLCASQCTKQMCIHNPCMMNAIGPMSA